MKYRYVFVFRIIPSYWRQNVLSFMVDNISINGMAAQAARESAAMLLTYLGFSASRVNKTLLNYMKVDNEEIW